MKNLLVIDKSLIEEKIKELEENIPRWKKFSSEGNYKQLSLENANIQDAQIELKIYKEILNSSINGKEMISKVLETVANKACVETIEAPEDPNKKFNEFFMRKLMRTQVDKNSILSLKNEILNSL